ncbi:divalent-cation tolerance protein CutA [candidate division KSB1 bacterium]
MADGEKILMLVTTASQQEAASIGKALVDQRLAACCSILPNIQSYYWWDGKVSEDSEVLLMIKTMKSVEEKAIDTIRGMHSYEVPEMISLPMIGGYDKYFQWMEENIAT